VVVVRYYGGTKLGTGGLVRAYSEAASLALDSASVREVILRTRVQIRFDYQDTSGAMHVISQFDAVIAGTEYGDDTVIQLDLRSTQVAAFADAFIEALSGRGQLEHESA
jgi:putative IMPACT (imprinted ancient) family translation regulator